MSNVLRFPTGSRADELVDALRAADADAITLVYRENCSKVRNYARRILHDEAAAEDVVHDAFVALPKALKRFRGDSSLETFIIGIAVNLCRRQIRSSSRKRRAVQRLEEREVSDPVSTPEQETRRRELAAALNRGLRSLSIDHREAFVLCAIDDRSSREAAAILDIPEGTVRTRLFHARKKLRTFLEAEGFR